MTRIAPAALVACVALAACQAPPEQVVAANNEMATNIADNMAEAPRSILRPEVVEAVEEKIEPQKVVIGFGASPMALDDAAKGALDALIANPAMKAGGPITLRGHSDSRGSDGDNKVASRLRAEKVRDYLVEKGVAQDRITLVPLGEARPVAPNAQDDGSDDPEGRAKNRRVEVIVALPLVHVPPPVVLDKTEKE